MGWSAFRTTGLTFHNPNLSVKGYTLFCHTIGDEIYLLNMAGQVVQVWTFPNFTPNVVQLLPNGNLMVAGIDAETKRRAKALDDSDFSDLNLHFLRLGGGHTELREYNFDGKLLWSYENPAMHHDFHVMENGHILFPQWVPLSIPFAKAVRGGNYSRSKNRPPMLGDDVIEIDRDGRVCSRVETWRLFDQRKDPIQPLQNRWEWTHMNSIDLIDENTLLISCRANSRVAQIDRKRGEMTWKIGPPLVSLQHHATALPNGCVQIFDNGMNRNQSLPYSRVIEVDPNTDEITWFYEAQPTQQFYSGHISSAQRLEMGNVLICEGTSGRLFEVSRKSEIVWEWITPIINGTPEGDLSTCIYRAYRYPLNHPAFANRDLDPQRYRALNEALGLS